MAVTLFYTISLITILVSFIYLGIIYFHPEVRMKNPKLSFFSENLKMRLPEKEIIFTVENHSNFPTVICTLPGPSYNLMAKTQAGCSLHWKILPGVKLGLPEESDFLIVPGEGRVKFSLPVRRERGPRSERIVFGDLFYFEEPLDTLTDFKYEFRYDASLSTIETGKKLGFKDLYKGEGIYVSNF